MANAKTKEMDNDKILKEVAKRTRLDEQIDDLGRALDRPVYEIQAAQKGNDNGKEYNGSLRLLRTWYQGQLKTEWRQKLVEAIKLIGRQGILEECFLGSAPEPQRVTESHSTELPVARRSDDIAQNFPSPSSADFPLDKWSNSKVKVSTPRTGDLDPEMQYIMWKSCSKGNALIIGNAFQGKASPRPWAEMDIRNMERLLKRLGYNFEKGDRFIYRNLHKQGMEDAIKDFTVHLEASKPQSAVVYISSHGNETGVCGNDDTILSLPDLLKQFEGVLPSKPKVVFIDACWGGEETSLIPVSRPNFARQPGFLPKNADIFMIHSTAYGKIAWSYENLGSWFVDQLCEVVYNTDRDLEDLDTIMLRVTRGIRPLGDREGIGSQSTTVLKQGVDRKLFFYPGYKEPEQGDK